MDKVHIHDTTKHRLIENTDEDSLCFEVDYPVDWENNKFDKRMIKFTDIEISLLADK